MGQRAMYRSREWQELREQAIARAAGVCEVCHRPRRPHRDTHVHPWPPPEDGDPMPDLSAVEVRCMSCHRKRPSEERIAFRRFTSRMMNEERGDE